MSISGSDMKRMAEELTKFHQHLDPAVDDGACHLLRNGQEQYSFESSEEVCQYNCDQLNQQDTAGNWTYQWNSITKVGNGT